MNLSHGMWKIYLFFGKKLTGDQEKGAETCLFSA